MGTLAAANFTVISCPSSGPWAGPWLATPVHVPCCPSSSVFCFFFFLFFFCLYVLFVSIVVFPSSYSDGLGYGAGLVFDLWGWAMGLV